MGVQAGLPSSLLRDLQRGHPLDSPWCVLSSIINVLFLDMLHHVTPSVFLTRLGEP